MDKPLYGYYLKAHMVELSSYIYVIKILAILVREVSTMKETKQ